MSEVAGTLGYQSVVETFTRASQTLEFAQVNKDFLEFLPKTPAKVLDAGAGVGQNAAALDKLGYKVTAFEPLGEFVEIAKSSYPDLGIEWVQDSFPSLSRIEAHASQFDFILVDGVWQHLDVGEREEAMERLSQLLNVGGILAMSLRHGPAGVGKHAFPIDADITIAQAEKNGLQLVKRLSNQPSIMKNKKDVTWTRVAFQKLI